MANNYEGPKYAATKNLSRVELAKLIRADIKEASQLARENPRHLPAGIKVSVRCGAGSSSIQISITAFNGPVVNPAAELMQAALPSVFHRLPRHTREINRCIEALEDLAQAYNYDKSEIETDYFNTRFYLSVGVDHSLESTDRARLQAEWEISNLLKDIKVNVAAGKLADAQRQCEAETLAGKNSWGGALDYSQEHQAVRDLFKAPPASVEMREESEEQEIGRKMRAGLEAEEATYRRKAALQAEIDSLRAEIARLKVRAPGAALEAERAQLIAQADADHRGLPQYAHHWDGWQVATVTMTITTKAGLAFERGDRVLVDPTERPGNSALHAGPGFAFAYSWRTKLNTSIPQPCVSTGPALSLVRS